MTVLVAWGPCLAVVGGEVGACLCGSGETHMVIVEGAGLYYLCGSGGSYVSLGSYCGGPGYETACVMG